MKLRSHLWQITPCLLLPALLLSVCSSGTRAQQDDFIRDLDRSVGTRSIKYAPQYDDGKLVSCYLTFISLVRDGKDPPFGYSMVGGLLGVTTARGVHVVALKVIVVDYDLSTRKQLQNAPESSYFVFGETTSKDSLLFKFPIEGGVFSGFKTIPTVPLMVQGLNNQRLTIAFTRREDGREVLVPLDLTVAETDKSGNKTHSARMIADLAACGTQLEDEMRATKN